MTRYKILLGVVAAAKDEAEKAIEHNPRALQLESENVDVWHNLGLAYLQTERPNRRTTA